MARKWQNQDSARTMTYKYNETADEVEALKKTSKDVNQATLQEIERLDNKIDKKVSTKQELGLGNVDNTSDMEKPLSNPQARAIGWATEDMLTSIPSDNEPEEFNGIMSSVIVVGTKLTIIK